MSESKLGPYEIIEAWAVIINGKVASVRFSRAMASAEAVMKKGSVHRARLAYEIAVETSPDPLSPVRVTSSPDQNGSVDVVTAFL